MSKFELSDGLDENKIFLLNLSQLSTQWSANFYHKERLKYLDIFLNPNYKFDIKRLNKIINISSQKSIASKVDNYIGMANIESNTGKYISSEKDKGKGDCSLFKKGDVLFGKLRPYLNKVYLAEFNGGCTTEFIVMDTLNENIISNKFLSIFLLLDCVVNQTKHMMTGNTLPRLQTFDIENLIIPIPPKEIQQKIIDIMNNAYIQKKQKEQQAKELLDSIDNYLLDELGIVLPEIDNSLKKRIFEVNLSEISGGRFDSYFYTKEYKNLIKSILNSKFPTYKLKEKCIFIAGYAFKSNDYCKQSNALLITIKNIFKNSINLKKVTYLPDNFLQEYKKYLINKNDLLIAMTGATIGKVALFNVDKSALLNQRNGIIRSSLINTDFLMNLLNIELYQKIILINAVGGAQPNISETGIMNLNIPFPPLEKQNEIAKYIQTIRDKAKKLKTEATQDLENAKLEVEKMILGK